MGNEFFKERIFPVLFMVLVTVVCIFPIAAIYLSTQDLVERNEFLFLKTSILYAADIPVPVDPAGVETLFQARVREAGGEDGQPPYYQVLSEKGDPEAFVVRVAGPGLWGEIEAVVGFRTDLRTLSGIDFIKQNETPGLGARITEDWFREQFRGKSGPFIMVPEGQSRGSAEVDAITGASRTSEFVLDIINRSTETVQKSVRQEG